MVEYMSDQPSVHDMQLLFAKKRLTELQEAVRWERECENFTHYARHAADWLPYTWRGVSEIFESCKAARAAVDALVGEG